MKTIKFLTLIMLLSLAWIGCEDRTKVKVDVDQKENSEATLDDAYRSSKTELEKSIIDMRNRIDAKIVESETEFNAATDDRKAEITVRLDDYRKRKSDLDRIADRIASATAEGWSDVEREAAEVMSDIKDALD